MPGIYFKLTICRIWCIKNSDYSAKRQTGLMKNPQREVFCLLKMNQQPIDPSTRRSNITKRAFSGGDYFQDFEALIACSRSSSISSMFSNPTDNLISPSVIPDNFFSSGDSFECVVEDG